MVRRILLAYCCCLLTWSLWSQEFSQISMGPSYAAQSFYNLAEGTEQQLSHQSWDLLFTTIGLQDAGIHLNEATASSFAEPAPELRLFLAPVDDFEAEINPDSLTQRLYNDEASWLYGALNAPREASNPFDFGWGVYEPTTNRVVGNRVFAIQLRSGAYKKIMIESLDGGAYQLKYADLDGSNEVSIAIPKTGDSGRRFAYFSFENGLLEEAPVGWDLLFTRYVTPLDDGTGQLLDYVVTGILSGYGVEVARIEGINPTEVTAETPDSFSTRLDAIGYDWKEFDFQGGWLLPDDLSYVVKDRSGELYKLVFIDFEGSSTGTATMEKTQLDATTSRGAPPSGPFTALNVFPNPVDRELEIAYSLTTPQTDMQLQLFDAMGRLAWSGNLAGGAGLNARRIVLPDLPAGPYVLRLHAGGGQAARRIIVK